MQSWHSPYLYGMHEPPPRDVLPHGWIVHLVEVGDNPEPHPGLDVSQWDGYGHIARLQYSWSGAGTFPLPFELDAYLERVRTCVANSPDVHLWIPGNEPNHPNEWREGYKWPPEYAAHIYDHVWEVVHLLPGHEQDEVLLPPVAPWTDLVGMGWIPYFERLIAACDHVDAIALHTYSRGPDPQSIISEARMDAPYQDLRSGFRAYRDFLTAVPAQYRDRPVYVTETNQGDQPWSTENTGWVQAAYREIAGQDVRCLCLYRWPHADQWGIEGNRAVIDDLRATLAHEHKWTEDDTMLLLRNASFEEGWHEQGAPELILPDYWTLEYRDGDHPWCEPPCKRPEVKPNQEHVAEGQYSVRAFPPAHSRGLFGLWQEVEAEPGAWYRFTAQVRIESNPPGEMAAFAGIQPWGAGLFERQMVWGKETQVTGQWQAVSVTAQAFGPRIRVALGANNKWPTDNNTVWFDDCRLGRVEWDEECPEPEPDPGGCDEEAIAQAVVSGLRDWFSGLRWVVRD